MRKIIVFLFLFTIAFPVIATPFSDISIRCGHAGFYDFKEKNSLNLDVMLGVSFGLTKHLEVGFSCISPIMPKPFSSVLGGVELGISVLGNRVSDYDNTMGSMINMVIRAGFFIGFDNEMLVSLRLVPLSVGTPMKGIRESFMPVGVFYNIKKKSLGIYFSLGEFDYYIRGSWRDNK